MSIKFKLLSGGGFVCGDTETRRTSFAATTSFFADKAKADPEGAAREMLLLEDGGEYMPDFDDFNWEVMTEGASDK